MKKFRLYHYWRSSASWRVRWALAHKGFGPDSIEFVPINLLADDAESAEHRVRNPFGYVPALELMDGQNPKNTILTESVAILEYLEEKYPNPALLPSDLLTRAKIRSLVEAVNAGTQPLQNLNAQYIHAPDSLEGFADKRKDWAFYWLTNGMRAYEEICKPIAGDFSSGDTLSFADLFLIPQCYAALRVGVNLENYPTVFRIYNNALKTDGYRASEPERFKPDEIPT